MFINSKEHQILSLIYCFRCLTFEQIYNYIFQKDGLSCEYCANILSKMVKQGDYIEKIGYYKTDSYYQLKNNGILCLRKFGLLKFPSDNTISSEATMILPSHEVRINNAVSQHQLSLNQFVFDFMRKFPVKNYYDEKYVSRIFKNIRPDGIIKTNNRLYFLEMDMNTERKSRLVNKWDNYRKFIHSEEYYGCNYEIKVLFILENVSSGSSRKKLLQKYIFDNLKNEICPAFNLYIDTKDNLLSYIKMDFDSNEGNDILFSLHNKGFSISKGVFPDIAGFSFDNYVYMKDNEGGLLYNNGVSADFVLDDYRNGNMYTYCKYLDFPKYASLFLMNTGRELKYIIIVNEIKEAYELLLNTDKYYENVYFTTPERLNSFTFNSSLFRIERNNILYHFDDGDIRVKYEEQYVSSSL